MYKGPMAAKGVGLRVGGGVGVAGESGGRKMETTALEQQLKKAKRKKRKIGIY